MILEIDDLIDKRAHIVHKKKKKIREEIMAVRYPPKDDKEIEELGRELLKFARNPNNLEINTFATDRWYNPYRLWKLADTNEFFRDCLEMAKSIMSDRKRVAACTREQDSASVFKLLPLIDVEYAQLRREESERVTRNIEALRKREDVVFKIVAEPIADSPLVPMSQSVMIDKIDEKE